MGYSEVYLRKRKKKQQMSKSLPVLTVKQGWTVHIQRKTQRWPIFQQFLHVRKTCYYEGFREIIKFKLL